MAGENIDVTSHENAATIGAPPTSALAVELAASAFGATTL
jgi:hypothetical protein